MKTVFLAFAGFLLLGWAQAQTPTPAVTVANPEELATINWESTSHNFGEIAYQEPQTVAFTFTNHSAQPVMITEAKGSCGCTVASFTQEAIAPGEAGTVNATYNAATLGAFHKTVSVKTTAQDEWHTLKISGIVVE